MYQAAGDPTPCRFGREMVCRETINPFGLKIFATKGKFLNAIDSFLILTYFVISLSLSGSDVPILRSYARYVMLCRGWVRDVKRDGGGRRGTDVR
jgi:hypothetical protein